MATQNDATPAARGPPPAPAQLGLGCVTFGREIGRAEAFALMDHALAHGIAFFDTAAAYGHGASETLVGEWLAARGARARVTLATKIVPPFTPADIATAVTASQRRLHDVLDVLFVHRWDAQLEDPATLEALADLVRQGRVRALAASNFSAGQLTATVERQMQRGLAPFRLLQNIHNFAVRSIDAPMRAACARAGVAIVTYSPLGAGFLTGKHEERVQPGSRFDLMPAHQPIYFNDLARARLARLQEISRQTGVPRVALALAWALRQPQVDTVLVGGRTPAHLDQALAARQLADPALLALLGTE